MAERGKTRGAKLLLMVLIFLGVTPAARAQTATEEGLWASASIQGNVRADSSWRWSADMLVRSRDGAGTLDFAAGGFMLSRRVTKRTTAGAAYLYAAGFPESGPLFEHRFLQQVMWKRGDRTVVSFKTRLEERFVSGQNALLRVRQQVRVAWPLVSRGRLQGIVAEELFVQSEARALAFRLDGHRLLLGVGRPLTERSVVEIGYMHVYAGHGSPRSRRSHVMSIAVSKTL
jgi:hypothetical protein